MRLSAVGWCAFGVPCSVVSCKCQRRPDRFRVELCIAERLLYPPLLRLTCLTLPCCVTLRRPTRWRIVNLESTANLTNLAESCRGIKRVPLSTTARGSSTPRPLREERESPFRYEKAGQNRVHRDAPIESIFSRNFRTASNYCKSPDMRST